MSSTKRIRFEFRPSVRQVSANQKSGEDAWVITALLHGSSMVVPSTVIFGLASTEVPL